MYEAKRYNLDLTSDDRKPRPTAFINGKFEADTNIIFTQILSDSFPILITLLNKPIKASGVHTDGNNILHTQLVKHYNDLLERQCSERGKDEVSYFYVGDVFCIHLGIKYADFQEKIFVEISGKRSPTLCIT